MTADGLFSLAKKKEMHTHIQMAFDVDRDGAQEDLIVDQALTYMEAFD